MAGNFFEIDGLDICRARFKGMRERCKNPSEVMKIVGAKAWRGVVDQNFRDEKEKSGTKWAPLSNSGSWLRQYGMRGTKQQGRGRKLLQDTGFLRRSTGFDNKIDEARVYNDCKYAAVHNFGSTKKNIPARQFLYVSDPVMFQILKTMTKYLTDGSFTVL